MNRDEEIKGFAITSGLKVRDEAIIGGLTIQSAEAMATLVQASIIKGCEWADNHPRKGLVDIEKVCEWLEPILKDHAGYNCGSDLLNDFRKALEEY